MDPYRQPWDSDYVSRFCIITAIAGMVGGERPIRKIWSVPLELAMGMRLALIYWDQSCSFPGDPQFLPFSIVFLLAALIFALPPAFVVSALLWGSGHISENNPDSLHPS